MRINFFGDYITKDPYSISISDNLRSIINSADYNVVNFEAPLEGYGEKQHKSGPVLSQSRKSPIWLRENNFNVYSLANNHFLDYGYQAAMSSINAFAEDTFHVGTGIADEALQPIILSDNRIKVAIFSLAELQFGILHDEWNDKQKYGCGWINNPKVNNIIRNTKSKVDYIVLIAHAGLEGVDLPLPEWRSRYHELIDCGCDIIIGGHTHTCQGFEKYKNKYICYSLGNFCFPQKLGHGDSWHNGEMVLIDMDKDGLNLEIMGIQLNGHHLELLPQEDWENKLARLNSLLLEDQYLNHVNEIVLKQLEFYNSLFNMSGYIYPNKNLLKSIGRYILGRCNSIHLLNNLQCETHRWCIARALKLKLELN